jgi:hypothetical protein
MYFDENEILSLGPLIGNWQLPIATCQLQWALSATNIPLACCLSLLEDSPDLSRFILPPPMVLT